MMRAMIFNRTGGPEVFKYAEVPTPEPGSGEILVRVAFAGVNPADWKNREGMLSPFRPYEFPCIIGFDAAGLVAAVGENVSGFEVGDRVFTPTNHGQGASGSYAEYTLARSDRVAQLPQGIDFREGAALPVAALTAWQALFERVSVKAGEQVLVHGGAGGVGSFAVQFARLAGASVAATCSTDNVDYLESLGVDRVIDYRTEDINAAIADWAPGGLDTILDAVGFSTLPDAMAMLERGGTLVSVATLVDDRDFAAAQEEASRRGVNHVYAIMSDEGCGPALSRIAELVVTGEIQLPPIIDYPLTEVASVHAQMQHGHARGKRVLRVAAL